VSLYKCSDCGKPTAEVRWIDDNTPASDCCDAPVSEFQFKHGDDCCCYDCDPDGLAQMSYSRLGMVL
jgi:hypothetical protein